MAYYSGTAASLTALRTALLTHAQADGWTLTGSVLSKAGVYFQITEDANNVKCLGCESNAVANPAPCAVMVGKIYERSGYTTRLISFPCDYEVFGFAQELYLVVNYDVDTYQWMAFGKSTVPGLPGQGGWCGASVGGAVANGLYLGSGNPILLYMASAFNVDTGSQSGCTPAALFFSTALMNVSNDSRFNSFVNSGLDGTGWLQGASGTEGHYGLRAMGDLLMAQPNSWNSEATLLPIRAWKARPSSKISMTADLEFARHIRIDNLSPGDILTIGSDQWKVFPWYRKDVSARNGGYFVNHTGTFGWAIRYEGP